MLAVHWWIRPWKILCGVGGAVIRIGGSRSFGIGSMQKQFLNHDDEHNMIFMMLGNVNELPGNAATQLDQLNFIQLESSHSYCKKLHDVALWFTKDRSEWSNYYLNPLDYKRKSNFRQFCVLLIQNYYLLRYLRNTFKFKLSKIKSWKISSKRAQIFFYFIFLFHFSGD